MPSRSELPAGTAKMLQWAARAGIDVRILSDCNSLFISHILTGARPVGPPLLLLPMLER